MSLLERCRSGRRWCCWSLVLLFNVAAIWLRNRFEKRWVGQ